MTHLGRIVTAAAIGGIVVGGVFGLFTASDAEPATLARDAVPVYACPGDLEVGTLHRGDRVLVIGRSGDWLAVRNARGSGERVFIRAAAIVPDEDLSNLPEMDCADVGTVAVATTVDVDESTTTTEATGESTTTSSSSTSTTTSSTTTSSTTTSSTTTTSATGTTGTTAPDTTPPSMSNASASPPKIWEQDGESGGFDLTCVPPEPRTASVSVTVSDSESGVASVAASWTDPLGSHTTQMAASGSVYSFTLGPYPASTFPKAGAPYEHPVAISLVAIDAAGNSSQIGVVVTVVEIDECFD